MGFRLVPKSVTLNDLQRRNGLLVSIIWPNWVAFGPYYAKVVEDTPIHGDIRRGSPPARALKCISSQNFAYNQP